MAFRKEKREPHFHVSRLKKEYLVQRIDATGDILYEKVFLTKGLAIQYCTANIKGK